jgi:hypothetical protein
MREKIKGGIYLVACDHRLISHRFSLPFFVGGQGGREYVKKKVTNPSWQTISLHTLLNKIISRGKKKEKRAEGSPRF